MPSDQVMRFLTQGYLVMRNVLPPDELLRAREAFDGAVEKGQFAEEKTGKDYFGLKNIFDIDDIFLDLVNHPVTFPVVREAIGDDVHLETAQGVFLPPGADLFKWHWDTHAFQGVNIEMSPRFRAKLHYFLADVPEDRGCLGYVPGSHRFRTDELPEVERLEDMPGHVRLPMKAGDALLIHIHGWHTVFPNTSDEPRKSIILVYSHSWMKRNEKAKPSDLTRIQDDPVKMHLFGVGEDKGYKGTRLPPVEAT